MAIYYMASKLSFVACGAQCIAGRRRKSGSNDKGNFDFKGYNSSQHPEVSIH